MNKKWSPSDHVPGHRSRQAEMCSETFEDKYNMLHKNATILRIHLKYKGSVAS